jgi:hypothetical protein
VWFLLLLFSPRPQTLVIASVLSITQSFWWSFQLQHFFLFKIASGNVAWSTSPFAWVCYLLKYSTTQKLGKKLHTTGTVQSKAYLIFGRKLTALHCTTEANIISVVVSCIADEMSSYCTNLMNWLELAFTYRNSASNAHALVEIQFNLLIHNLVTNSPGYQDSNP